jgi:hypothetical protein
LALGVGGNAIVGLFGSVVSAVAAPIDRVPDALLAALGIEDVDVSVAGVRCDGSAFIS